MFVLSMWSNRHLDPFDGALGKDEIPLFLLLSEHSLLDLASQHAGFVEQQLEFSSQLIDPVIQLLHRVESFVRGLPAGVGFFDFVRFHFVCLLVGLWIEFGTKVNRHRDVTAHAALGHDRHPPVRMGAKLRVTLLKHPQQDVLIEHQHRPWLNAQKLRVRLERHLGSIDRNKRHAMRHHIEFNSVQRLMIGNRFQERDDPFRLEELQRIIQR